MEQLGTAEDVQIGGPLGLASNEGLGPADAYEQLDGRCDPGCARQGVGGAE